MMMSAEEYFKFRKGIELTKIRGYNHIILDYNVTHSIISETIAYLKEVGIGFRFFDALYPSMSDPGGLITYSQEKVISPDTWSMCVANHGWSGGIYLISESTIVIQLENLIRKKLLEDIQIENVYLFGGDLKETYENEKKDKEIRAIHQISTITHL